MTGAEITLLKLKRLTRWIIILRICQGQESVSFLGVRYRFQEGTRAPHPRGLPGGREDPKKWVAKNSLLKGRMQGHRGAVASVQGTLVRKHGGVRAYSV